MRAWSLIVYAFVLGVGVVFTWAQDEPLDAVAPAEADKTTTAPPTPSPPTTPPPPATNGAVTGPQPPAPAPVPTPETPKNTTEITVDIPGKLTVKAEGVERPNYTSKFSPEITSIVLMLRPSDDKAGDVTLTREVDLDNDGTKVCNSKTKACVSFVDRPLPDGIKPDVLLNSVVVHGNGAITASVVQSDGKPYLRLTGAGTIVVSYVLPERGDWSFVYSLTADWPSHCSAGSKKCENLARVNLSRQVLLRNLTLEEWPLGGEVSLQSAPDFTDFKMTGPVAAGGTSVSIYPFPENPPSQEKGLTVTLVGLFAPPKSGVELKDDTPLPLQMTIANWPDQLKMEAAISLAIGSGNDSYRQTIDAKAFKSLTQPNSKPLKLPADPLLTVSCRSTADCKSVPTKEGEAAPVCGTCTGAEIQNGILTATLARHYCVTNKHSNPRFVTVEKPKGSDDKPGAAAEAECICVDKDGHPRDVPITGDKQLITLLPEVWLTSRDLKTYKGTIDAAIKLVGTAAPGVTATLDKIQTAIKTAEGTIKSSADDRTKSEDKFFRFAFAPIGRSKPVSVDLVQETGKAARKQVDAQIAAWRTMYCEIVLHLKLCDRCPPDEVNQAAPETVIDPYPTQQQVKCCGDR